MEYQRKADCYSHETLDEIVSLDAGRDEVTGRQLLSQARELLGDEAEIELGRDVLEKLVCPQCQREEVCFTPLSRVRTGAAWCPHCVDSRREVVTFHKLCGGEPFLDRTLADLGVPAFDILVARCGSRSVGLELTGDATAVLGTLAGGENGVQWL
jgi:adenylyltransferase/sulfurtransferase